MVSIDVRCSNHRCQYTGISKIHTLKFNTLDRAFDYCPVCRQFTLHQVEADRYQQRAEDFRLRFG